MPLSVVLDSFSAISAAAREKLAAAIQQPQA
jgi:hypothetical protein